MDGFRLLANEFKLLSRSNLARFIVALTAGFGALGINAVDYSNQMSLHAMHKSSATASLGSAQYAAMVGAAMFAMLTLLTLSRDRRKRSRDLLDASRQYTTVVTARIGTLLAWACLTTLVTLLSAWLSHLALCEFAYEPWLYLFSYATVSFPAMVFSVLICSGLYLAFESLDVAFLSFGVLYMQGFTSSDYLLCWVQTSASTYSDLGGIEPVGRFIVYNRLFWVWLCLAVMLAGLLLRRRQGCGVTGSIAQNAKGRVVPILLAVTAGLAVLVYQQEPYLFPQDSTLQLDLPVTESARLQEVQSEATLHTAEHALAAEVRYVFEKDPEATEIVFVTNAGLDIESARVNGSPASWRYIPNTDRIRMTLPLGDRADVDLKYRGTIKVPYPSGFTGYICRQSVYLLENSHWLFQPLTDNAERIRISGTGRRALRHLTVATPGRLDSVADAGPMRLWKYRATTSNLNLGLFGADYRIEKMRVGDLEVELYVSSRHEKAVAELELDKHVRGILEHYQESLGPYAFTQYPLKLVEVPLYKTGGHSSLNVVTLAEYFFNRKPPDSPSGEMRFIVHDLKFLAHELAHQWWGSGVEIPLSGGWSSEGLTEFTVYRYFADRYPEPVKEFVVRGWEDSVRRNRNNYYVKHPEVLRRMRPEFAEKFMTGLRQAAMYNAMPLKLIKAEEHFGAEEFARRLSAVYQKHQGGRLTFDEFLAETGLTEEDMALD